MTPLPLTTRFPMASRLGYGCMGLGGDWDSPELTDADREVAFSALDAAVEAGITLFDHADIYRQGKAERVFGEWLAARPGLRERLVIQSKGGIRLATDTQPGHYNADPAYLEDCIHHSLERLGIDHLDLWLLHRPDPLWEPDRLARCFHALQSAGKVTYFGVSNMHHHQLALLGDALGDPPLVNQLEISLARRELIEADISFNTGAAQDTAGTVDFCRRRGIQLQAWGCLAGGRYSREASSGPAAALVAELAGNRQCSAEAIVLAWLLRHPAGIQPLVGSTQPSRIAACADATGLELSREDWYRLYIAARENPLP